MPNYNLEVSSARMKQLNVFKYKQAKHRIPQIEQTLVNIDQKLSRSIEELVTDDYYMWKLDSFAGILSPNVHRARDMADDMASSINFLQEFCSNAPTHVINQNPRDKKRFEDLLTGIQYEYRNLLEEKTRLTKSLEDTKLEAQHALHDFVVLHGEDLMK